LAAALLPGLTASGLAWTSPGSAVRPAADAADGRTAPAAPLDAAGAALGRPAAGTRTSNEVPDEETAPPIAASLGAEAAGACCALSDVTPTVVGAAAELAPDPSWTSTFPTRSPTRPSVTNPTPSGLEKIVRDDEIAATNPRQPVGRSRA